MFDPLLDPDDGRPATVAPPPEPVRTPRPTGRPHRRRQVAIGAVLVLAVLLVPVAWSYGHALTGPGHDSWKARSVEWMREHHMGSMVDWAERHWFASHQAKVGGSVDSATAGPQLATASGGQGRDGATGTSSTGTSAPAASVAGTTAPSTPDATDDTGTVATGATPVVTLGSALLPLGPGRLGPPPALAPPASPPFPGEGQWHPFGPAVAGAPGAYATTIRPDAVHTSSVIGVVWFDPHAISFRQFPGTKIPGSPWDRPPYVPPDLQPRLLAAFSGGFRINNSHGGMLLGGHQLTPMRDGAATFAVDANGVATVGAWGTDVSTANRLDSARQNLDLIVEGGAPNPALASDPNKRWGFTGPANHEFVWRSGAGVLPNGALVWVGGPGLSVSSLADVFVRLGAVRAMQLDINQEWMQFVSYSVGADGQVHGRRLLHGMRGPDDRWLTTDTRDFIAAFTRS